jgi:protein-arginine kinase activator protein McsA
MTSQFRNFPTSCHTITHINISSADENKGKEEKSMVVCNSCGNFLKDFQEKNLKIYSAVVCYSDVLPILPNLSPI